MINARQAPAELITPQEITAIMERAGTVTDIDRALEVAAEYISRNGAPADNREWHYICMLSNIYQAGRIQGIREQRAKQAAKGNHTHTHTHTQRLNLFRFRLAA